MLYELWEILEPIGWLAIVAALLTLLTKPTGFRFWLLVLGLLCWALIEVPQLREIEEDILILFIVVGNLAWLAAGALTLLHLQAGRGGVNADTSGSIKEALTVIPITDDNPAEMLNAARQSLYHEIETSLDANILPEGVNIQLLQSQNYSDVTFVSLSLFQPAVLEGDLAKKLGAQSVLLIRLHAHPFMTFPITFNIRIESSNKHKEFDEVYDLSVEQLSALITQLLQGEKWNFKPMQLKQAPLQFWRPSNTVRDYKDRRGIDVIMLLIPPLLIFPLIGRLLFGKARRLKLTTGKPATEPRHLLQLDSWQVAIKGLQAYANQLETEFVDAMKSSTSQFGKLSEENIWYWGIDGKVERKQHVFSIGRALVFIKIYAYGEDLYIGWDAHVNAGSWAEKNIGSGFARHDDTRLDVFAIESEWHQPNEFDISDANFALETVHATLVKLTKRLTKERDIDQEIDFTIVRESRSGVLNQQQKSPENKGKKRFMRTG